MDDAWKDVETLLGTVYSTFPCSTVKRRKINDLAKILDEETLGEVRGLSWHQSRACCSEELHNTRRWEDPVDNRDPVANYGYKKLRDNGSRLLSLLWEMVWVSWHNSAFLFRDAT